MGNLKTENTSYPTSLDTATAIVANVDNPSAVHVNGPVSAIIAIETELGTNPSGASATVSARLTAIEGGSYPPSVHASTHVTGGGDTIASVVAGGNAGLMTGADKTKLDGIATGANVSVFTKDFESTEQTITAAGSLQLTHGLGTEPIMVQILLVCQTAEYGYSIGNHVVVPVTEDNGTQCLGCSMVVDSTYLNIKYSANTYCWIIVRKDNGGRGPLTNANWKAIFRAWA
jgi:hypothetical protein